MNPATSHDVIMYENINPVFDSVCQATSGEQNLFNKNRTDPSSPFDSWTPQAMLSFCAEPQGGVAESMIEP